VKKEEKQGYKRAETDISYFLSRAGRSSNVGLFDACSCCGDAFPTYELVMCESSRRLVCAHCKGEREDATC
jgi:uncharacterized membrane protein